MEMSEGNSLYKEKYHFFFFYKIREQEGGTGHAWERGQRVVSTSGRGGGGERV
jgi:hypothetical protein